MPSGTLTPGLRRRWCGRRRRIPRPTSDRRRRTRSTPMLGIARVSSAFLPLLSCFLSELMLTLIVDVVALGEGGDMEGAGSSRGAAPSRPHRKDKAAPQPRASKRTADPAGSARPAKRKRSAGCRCQNRRISGRGSRTMRLTLMVTRGGGQDVYPGLGPLYGGNTVLPA